MDMEVENNIYQEEGDNRNVKCRLVNNHNKRTNQVESFQRDCQIQKRKEQTYKDNVNYNDIEQQKFAKNLQQQERKLKLRQKRMQKQIDYKQDEEKMQAKPKRKVKNQQPDRQI
ncbi:unnamed protein product [Paramecium sonneborni]|uniref:Uncharacterized protein n=1 Tax=Paramecium sonneborni TaxID=65129 RepID=A0A8S1QUT7_9CILI|nr:unnamed protein product [Paramecium sonneborni]